MKLTPPPRGSIIRYAYLWADEERRGQEEGCKDRPALVLALVVFEKNGTAELLVTPVTHRPSRTADAVPLPRSVKQQLALDDMPSWIVTTEANSFVWPGPDLRPIPKRKPATVMCGQIPESLLRRVAQSFLANRERQRSILVQRK